MAEIMKVYTAEQNLRFLVNKIISDDVGITAMESGDAMYSLIEGVSELISLGDLNTLSAVRKAIRTMFYSGMDFRKKPATAAPGQVRPWRFPAARITYSGIGTTVKVTVTSNTLTIVSDDAGDNITVDLTTYTTITDAMAQINAHANYTAVAYKGDDNSNTLYKYADKEIIAEKTYNNTTGFDVMLDTDVAANITAPQYFTANDVRCQIQSNYTLPAGASTLFGIAASAVSTGEQYVNAGDLDTFNGIGSFSGTIDGIDHWIIDSNFAPGTEEETDEARKERFQTYVFGGGLHNVFGIASTLLEIDEIRSVHIRNNYPKRGYITAIVDDGTGTISTELQDEIDKKFYGVSGSEEYRGCLACPVTGLAEPANIQGVSASITVYKISDKYDDDAIISDVKTAIENHINLLPLGYDVVESSLITVAKNANAGAYEIIVNSGPVTVPSTHVARTGGAYGSVTVNVLLRDNP